MKKKEMRTLTNTYWSDISGYLITCPTICHYNPDLLTVHDIFNDNKVLSYLILNVFVFHFVEILIIFHLTSYFVDFLKTKPSNIILVLV